MTKERTSHTLEPYVVAWTFQGVRLSNSTSTRTVVTRLWSDGVMEAASWHLGSLLRNPPPSGANPFEVQPSLSEWVVIQEFTPSPLMPDS